MKLHWELLFLLTIDYWKNLAYYVANRVGKRGIKMERILW